MSRNGNMTAQAFRRLFIRNRPPYGRGEWVFVKYAWPGGYPLFLVMSDGGCLCAVCIESERGLIHQAALEGERNGWAPMGVDVNWEDPDLYCDHCGERIESAYAEPEEEEGGES